MRMFRRFGRDERGATFMEFALVGPMFIFLLLAIIEIGLTMLTQFVLDGGARTAARLVMTGQVQGSGGVGAFQTALCSQVETMIPSCSGVLFEVQTFANFSSINFSPCNTDANPPPRAASRASSKPALAARSSASASAIPAPLSCRGSANA